MKRMLIAAAIIVGLLVAWLVLARPVVLVVDTLGTVGEAVPASGPFVGGGGISIGERSLDFAGPSLQPAAKIEADASGRVVLRADGVVFPLGMRSDGATDFPWEVPFAPDQGDTVTIRESHSVVPWPSFFDIN